MNSIAYYEIQADEPERAIAFYSTVFDWKFIKQEGMPIDYWRIDSPDVIEHGSNAMFGGLLPRPAAAHHGGTNAYTCSMHVKSFDDTAGKILANGGIVALDKFAVPGKCYQGYFLDTEGNTFGIFEPDENAA